MTPTSSGHALSRYSASSIPPAHRGPERSANLREIYNTVQHQLRTGCQWELLPHDLLPKTTVHNYFLRWRKNHVLNRINEALVTQVRSMVPKADGTARSEKPSAASIDSQSVKSTQACEDRGYDGGKKITGRKRHIAVDTLGLLLAVFVSVASVDDALGAEFLVDQLGADQQPNLRIVWADNKYHNHALRAYIDRCEEVRWQLEVVRRPVGAKGFVLLPKRWVVERTFAWLDRYRRLSKDYERYAESLEAWIKLASINRMLRYLDPPLGAVPFKYRAGVEETVC